MIGGPSVVVIGHGESPEGRGLGERIDAEDAVVRLNGDISWQSREDYGSHWNIGVVPVRQSSGVAWAESGLDVRPAFWWGPVYDPKFIKPFRDYADKRRIDLRIVNVGHLVDLVARSSSLRRAPVLNRGVAAAMLAVEKLRPSRLVLVGHDNLVGRRRTTYHSSLNVSTPNLDDEIEGRHDYGAERDAIVEMTERSDCELEFWP